MLTTTKSHTITHFPFYYGWIVWGAATLGIVATMPAQGSSVSLFINDFIADFGVSRAAISALFSLATLTAALNLAWYGRMVDRYGSRRATVVFMTLYALTLVGFARINSAALLLVGMVALRNLGQGAIFLATTSAIAAWFEARRGRVMALAMIAYAVFQAGFVVVVARLLVRHDWHTIWLGLGVGVGVVVMPVLALLLRDHPEDYGLASDGAAITQVYSADDFTLRQAQHTLVFWVFVVGRLVVPLFTSGLVFHQVSIFAAGGYSATTAAASFSQASLLGVGFSLLFGYLLDRVHPGRVLLLHQLGLLGALGAALMMGNNWLLGVYIVAFSVVNGGGAIIDGAAWTTLFGRRHQGEIRGFVRMVTVIGTAAGPLLYGISHDVLGSYTPVMLVGLGITSLALVLNVWVNR